jgi:hypothetical protein
MTEGRECKAWPTRCRQPAVVSTMLEGTNLLATNRQIHDEAMQILLKENEILLTVRKAGFKAWDFKLDVSSHFIVTATERTVLEMARVLEVSPHFWEQLDVLAQLLSCRKVAPFKSLTINFCRLLNEFDYDALPSSREANARLGQLAAMGKVAEIAKVVWIGNGEADYLVKRVEGAMMGKIDVEREGCVVRVGGAQFWPRQYQEWAENI